MENVNTNGGYNVADDDSSRVAQTNVETRIHGDVTSPQISFPSSFSSSLMGTSKSMGLISALQLQRAAVIAVSEYRRAVLLALCNSLHALRDSIGRPATPRCETTSFSSIASAHALAAALRAAALTRAARPVAAADYTEKTMGIPTPLSSEQIELFPASSITSGVPVSQGAKMPESISSSSTSKYASNTGPSSILISAAGVLPASVSVHPNKVDTSQTPGRTLSNAVKNKSFQKRTFYRGVIDERRAPPVAWVTTNTATAVSPTSTWYKGVKPSSGFAYGAYRVDSHRLNEDPGSQVVLRTGVSGQCKDDESVHHRFSSFRVSIIANYLFHIGSDGRVRHHTILTYPP